MAKIVCFGEVLWDVFPDHKKIGGAPLNVALRLASFGHEVVMISAVGNDGDGKTILEFVSECGVSSDFIQISENYKTGTVDVTLDQKGSASYVIQHPSAWDKIELNENLKKIIKESDALVFGSLITRDKVSKETLFKLMELAKYKIFDVNLRPPHYSYDTIYQLMNEADFIKFNDNELYEICAELGSKYHNLEQNIVLISELTKTNRICVTKGEHGAVLLYDDMLYYNSGYQVKLKDTVGAGDSFLGTLISELLNSEHPQNAIDLACAVGALVAKSDGANPQLSLNEIKDFMNPQ